MLLLHCFAFIDYPIMENIDCYTTVTVPEVVMTTLIEGQFEFPQKTKLVSAVHIITVSKPLLEPYKLEIQHCVKLVTQAQVNSLHFVRAPYSLTILPYQFTLIEGQFNPGSRHGIVDIICQSTCLVAIVADQKQKTKDTDEENYIINQGTVNQGVLNELLQCNIYSSYRYQWRNHSTIIFCIYWSD